MSKPNLTIYKLFRFEINRYSFDICDFTFEIIFMLFLFSNLIGLPVGSLEDRAKVGSVKDIIINPDDGKVLGLTISTGMIQMHVRAVSWQDVREIDENGIVVADKDAIVPAEEIIRIQEIIKSGFSLINLPVQTTDGKNLGKIFDYSINNELGALSKIIVKQFLGEEGIISQSNIVRIEEDKVIVKSGKVKVGVPAMQTAESV